MLQHEAKTSSNLRERQPYRLSSPLTATIQADLTLNSISLFCMQTSIFLPHNMAYINCVNDIHEFMQVLNKLKIVPDNLLLAKSMACCLETILQLTRSFDL